MCVGSLRFGIAGEGYDTRWGIQHGLRRMSCSFREEGLEVC